MAAPAENGDVSAPVAGCLTEEASCVRIAWEGDFEALHSLAIVNRRSAGGLWIVGMT